MCSEMKVVAIKLEVNIKVLISVKCRLIKVVEETTAHLHKSLWYDVNLWYGLFFLQSTKVSQSDITNMSKVLVIYFDLQLSVYRCRKILVELFQSEAKFFFPSV